MRIKILIRLFGASILALFFVISSVGLLNLLQLDAVSAATPPAAPLRQGHLPTPFLSDDDVADAPYGVPNIWPPPAVDGYISPGEYAGAGKVTFPGYGGDVEVFFKQDASTLYVAFEIPDKVHTAPYASLYLDTNNDGGTVPQTDDFEFRVERDGSVWEYQGNGSVWQQNTPITWTYGLTETMSGWSVEFGIPFAKLGITAGTFKELGLMLGNWNAGPVNLWPSGANSGEPSTWGSLVSSSEWGSFYWKPGPWEDYAPSGMPDFDQRQDGWFLPGGPLGQVWTHDGPAAVANSLWWFDSKFETLTDTMPSTISDTYRLVTSYAISPTQWDDHHYSNTVPLVDDLAWYFDTNGIQSGILITGTDPVNMFHGIHNYLRTKGLWDEYIVTMVISPSFEWVAEEVMYSEDVILLLGFYEDINPDPTVEFWQRVGGHYVNVAGVEPGASMPPAIAFSDPIVDAAENGWGLIPPGRVLSGTLISHQPVPGHSPAIHNDAGNVSHDVYPVIDTNSPGGIWGPEMYGYDPGGGGFMFEPFGFLFGANPHPEILTELWQGGPIQTEVEYALAVSPYTWKSSGEWIVEGDDPVMGKWQPWQDYAPNGVPDFDQKQDGWQNMMGQWSFCGPVAAANSLWWFDTKFEPNPVGPPQPPPLQPPIPINDNYPMVWPYGPWDDHDLWNVDHPVTSWPGPIFPPPPPGIPPGMGEFVEDLAVYFQTDMIGGGTVITDMYHGLDLYITDHKLRQGYVITMTKSPEFWWVAEEVEVSEDVILLLGFWQDQGSLDLPKWVRLGGHYVTLPGVDKQGGFVAFSDPYYDGAEFNWPYAYPNGWPTVMGRVADGWIIPHPPYSVHPSFVHNDAGNISHDVYYVAPTDSPGGAWGPRGYVEGWDGNFYEQNGETTGVYSSALSVQTEVDWAIAVSPVADVWITKTVTPTIVTPGDWLTFTLSFYNYGSLPAENVVITDILPAELTNASYTYTLNYPGTLTTHDTYTWTVGTLKWMEGGVITVVAQVDRSLTWPAEKIITNTAEITTTSVEQYQIDELPDIASAPFTVQTADVSVVKSVTPTGSLMAGDWLTYTLVYTNNGPASAVNVILTDTLHSWLTNASTQAWTSYIAGAFANSGRYVWSIGAVPDNGWGIITITAQISPSLNGGGALPNDVEIATDTPEHDYTNNNSSVNNTVIYYGADLSPNTANIIENTGKTVTYTLTLKNTGNTTDTYAITSSVSGAVWTTTLPTSPMGPLASGNDAQFTVTVEIPASAADGEESFAVITATSQGDGTKWDTSALTTTATTQIITRGVELEPPSDAKTGDAGIDVVYRLTVTNTGSVTDTITFNSGATNWPTVVTPTHITLVSMESSPVSVTVSIPGSVTNGLTDTATITAQATGASDSSILTTTAIVSAATCTPITYVNWIQTPYYPQTGQVVTFTATPTPITATAPITYQWDFDDGGSASGNLVYHTFTVSKTYWVALIATNQCGGPAGMAHNVVVTGNVVTPTYGVELTPPTASNSGDAGSNVTYRLTVSNTGNAADTFNLATGGTEVWTTAVAPASVNLSPNASASVTVTVTISALAANNASDTVSVSATSQGDTNVSDSSVLTTTAVAGKKIYLPIILKN